jgi:hypothetical protein
VKSGRQRFHWFKPLLPLDFFDQSVIQWEYFYFLAGALIGDLRGHFSVAVVHVPTIASLIYSGLLGMTYTVLLLHMLYTLMSYPFIIRKFLGDCAKDWMQSFGSSMVVAASMGLLVWLIPTFQNEGTLTILAVQIMAGMVTYMTALALIQPSLISDARNVLNSVFS